MAEANLELNGYSKEENPCYVADMKDYVKDMRNGAFDLIILDPPAFAKHKDALRNALKGYTRLNAAAFSKIRPGGILFTFSCSQVVDRQAFLEAVFSAAAQTGRRVRNHSHLKCYQSWQLSFSSLPKQLLHHPFLHLPLYLDSD